MAAASLAATRAIRKGRSSPWPAMNCARSSSSTATSDQTIAWEDGSTYPVIDVEISSASHPFYTGNARVVDTAGRVERFNRRYGRDTGQARPAN
jgi:large subunit ribosomal protein L31